MREHPGKDEEYKVGGETGSQDIWIPQRSDAVLIGTISDTVGVVLQQRTAARQVYIVAETWQHIEQGHRGQFDMVKAVSLLEQVIASPILILANKTNAMLFAGTYDADHLLIAAIKVIETEIWLSTISLRNRKRFERDIERKGRVLYRGV